MNDVLTAESEAVVVRGRRRAIYVLVAFCAVFFVVGITASYVVAAHHGYGTGIGDGFTDAVPRPSGSGFLGDLAILGGNFILDIGILFFWYWVISRLEAISGDDPAPPDDGADLRSEESWYYIHVPGLTRVLVVIASFCTVGVSVLVAAILPVVLIRFGW